LETAHQPPEALSRAEARLRVGVGLALAREEDPRSIAEAAARPLETLASQRSSLGLTPRGLSAEAYVDAVSEGRAFDP
jgi:hypothetical protein